MGSERAARVFHTKGERADRETLSGAVRAGRRALRVSEHPSWEWLSPGSGGRAGARWTPAPHQGTDDWKTEVPRAAVTCVNVCLYC